MVVAALAELVSVPLTSETPEATSTPALPTAAMRRARRVAARRCSRFMGWSPTCIPPPCRSPGAEPPCSSRGTLRGTRLPPADSGLAGEARDERRLEGADVDPAADDSGEAGATLVELVAGERGDRVRSGVDRGAAREQRVGLRRSAVV